MLKSRTLPIHIERAAAEVYAFLVEPTNLGRWTTVKNGRPAPLEGPDAWSFDGPRGSVIVHFSPPNPLFVLDYWMTMAGHKVASASVRVIANGDGAELIHTSMQQAGTPDAVFDSEEEWLLADLLVLKSLMERLRQG